MQTLSVDCLIGEMLAGPAKLLLMDEISTGLDSSTTYQIVKSLRQKVHILNGTAFISLLQPAPETFELFDDIVLLSDGQIVYQGPRENLLEFFESIGFKCPARKGVADFLQEVRVHVAFLRQTFHASSSAIINDYFLSELHKIKLQCLSNTFHRADSTVLVMVFKVCTTDRAVSVVYLILGFICRLHRGKIKDSIGIKLTRPTVLSQWKNLRRHSNHSMWEKDCRMILQLPR